MLVQAESRASLEGSAHAGRSALFRENSLLRRHRGRDGSNTASLTDTTVGFIPSAKKGQPRRTGGKTTGRRDGQRQRPRLSRCLCLPKTLLPSAGRRGDVPAGAQALPLGSVGVLPRYSWAAGTWCRRGTAERLSQGAELTPVSGARPAGCWFFPWHGMDSRASALRQLLYRPAKGRAPRRSTMRLWVGSVGTGTPGCSAQPAESRHCPETPQAMAGGDTAEGIFLQQVPRGAGGEEEDGCGEASLVSLLCSRCSSPPKTCGKSELFLPAFAFPHKLALPISLLALICCEKTRRSPTTCSVHCFLFFPNAAGFAASLLSLTTGHLGHTDHGPLPVPAARSALLSSLLSSFPFPLSDPVPMEIPRHRWCHSDGAIPPSAA